MQKGYKNKPPYEEKGIRERILQEAARLFSEKGFSGTSVRDITQAARVTNPMLYYYFGNKEDLFLTLITEAFSEVDSAFRGTLENRTAPLRERLVCMLIVHFNAVSEMPHLARLFFSVQFGPQRQRFGQHMTQIFAPYEEMLRAMIEEAQQNGELRHGDVTITMMHMGGLINTPVLRFLNGEEVELNRDTAEALVDQFLEGAGPR